MSNRLLVRTRLRAGGSDFAIPLIRPGYIHPALTFSRASAAWLLENGALTSYATNAPRYSANGLLMEGARTNAGLYSEQIDNAAWVKYSIGTGVTPVVAANAAVAPDGATTADQITVNRSSATGASAVYQSFSSAASTYPVALWLRAATGGDAGQALSITQWSGAALINSTTYTLTASWGRVLLPNATALTAGAARHFIRIGYEQSVGAGTGQIQFLMWGVQAEAAAFNSSYIPTTPAAVIRERDALSGLLSGVPGAAAAGFTLLWRASVPQNAPAGIDQMLFQLDDGSDANRFRVRNPAAGATIIAGRVTASASVDATSLGSMTAGTAFSGAMAVNLTAGTASACLGKGTVRAITGGPTSGLTTLRIGDNFAATAALFGYLPSLSIIPTIMPDSALPALAAAA